jgi:hypothetical protein
MNTTALWIALVAAAFILGVIHGHCTRTTDGCPTIPNPPAPPEPRVQVIVPQDYKPLEPIMVDGKPALVGPRALLFYSAYQAAAKAMAGDSGDGLTLDGEYAAFETAKQAVGLVYGETFDT